MDSLDWVLFILTGVVALGTLVIPEVRFVARGVGGVR